MNVAEALQMADEWTRGHTFYEGMGGWRIAVATLAAEVKRLNAALSESCSETRAEGPYESGTGPCPELMKAHETLDNLLLVCEEVAGEAGQYWLDAQLRLCEAITVAKEAIG